MTEQDTVEKLQATASILASRYRDSQEYDDLFQEGFLAGWEALVSGSDVPTAIGAMRRAMNDYKNISLKPVYVPKSGDVRAFLKRLKVADGSHPQGTTERALYEALRGSTEGVQPSTLGTVKSVEDVLVEKDLYEYVTNHLWVFLSPEEATVVQLVCLEDCTQEEASRDLGLSQGTVSKGLASGLKKLKRALEVTHK